MLPPESLQVGPHRFEIVVDADAINQVCKDEHSHLSGFTNFNELRITIDPDQAPDQLADTVLHEVMHTVISATNLDFKWGHKKTEDIVLRITPVLLDVLRRNPQLVEFLSDWSGS